MSETTPLNPGENIVISPEEYNRLLQASQGSQNTTCHINLNGKYRVVFEKAASANKVDGFKVEVNGDDADSTFKDAQKLYFNAMVEVEKNKPAIPVPPTKQ